MRRPRLDGATSALARWGMVLVVGTCSALLGAALLVLPEVMLALLSWPVRIFLQRWLAWAVLTVAAVFVGRRWAPTPSTPVPLGRLDAVAWLICAAVALFVFTLPDQIWWNRTGALSWVCDYDDVLYLAVASQAYFNHPLYLADPARAVNGPALYSWIPCVPGVMLARLFGLGPIGIALVWRVLAAVSIASGWYLLVRRGAGSALIAGAVVLLLIADTGAMFGVPLWFPYLVTNEVRHGVSEWLRTPFRPAGVQWRVTTPGLIFLFIAVYLAVLMQARAQPQKRWIAAAGAMFGMLFYVYFYYWTAAALGLCLAFLFDRGKRAVYVHTAWIGLIIALPALGQGMTTRATASEALRRFDLFLPVSRYEAISIVPVEVGLLAVCLAWIFVARRDLVPVGCFALAGWALLNQHAVTGVQLQDTHWRLHAVGPALTIMMVLIALQWVGLMLKRSPRIALPAVLALCAVDLGDGVWLRATEATASVSPREQIHYLTRYRAQRRIPGSARLAPNAVVAGDEHFVDWAMILDNQRMLYSDFPIRHSLSVGHAEWNERAALNATLCGLSREEFYRLTFGRIHNDFWGPWTHDPSLRPVLLRERLAAFDAVAANLKGALDRYGVRYVGLKPERRPPSCRAVSWKLLQAGESWWVWECCGTVEVNGRRSRSDAKPCSGPET